MLDSVLTVSGGFSIAFDADESPHSEEIEWIDKSYNVQGPFIERKLFVRLEQLPVNEEAPKMMKKVIAKT